MEQKEFCSVGKPNLEIDAKPIETHEVTSLKSDEPIEHNNSQPLFRSVGKQYKKIAGKRYRIPRKAKKELKKNFYKRGWEIKKLKFSYKRLNRDVDGNKNE